MLAASLSTQSRRQNAAVFLGRFISLFMLRIHHQQWRRLSFCALGGTHDACCDHMTHRADLVLTRQRSFIIRRRLVAQVNELPDSAITAFDPSTNTR